MVEKLTVNNVKLNERQSDKQPSFFYHSSSVVLSLNIQIVCENAYVCVQSCVYIYQIVLYFE